MTYSALLKIDAVQKKFLILLKDLWLLPNSTGGLVKDTTLPGSGPCCATYADCLSSAINPHVRFRELMGSASDWFICRVMKFLRKQTWAMRFLEWSGYLIWGFSDLVLNIVCNFRASLGLTVWKEHNSHTAELDLKVFQHKGVKKLTDNTLSRCYFSVRHKRRRWVKRLISMDGCPRPTQRLGSSLCEFSLFLLLPVMEISRGLAWLGNSTSVFLSICHSGHEEHKQKLLRGVL